MGGAVGTTMVCTGGAYWLDWEVSLLGFILGLMVDKLAVVSQRRTAFVTNLCTAFVLHNTTSTTRVLLCDEWALLCGCGQSKEKKEKHKNQQHCIDYADHHVLALQHC